MSIIGIELNDTGILAYGGSPFRLLELDGQSTESPGFALPEKKRLLVGKDAESKARLFPRHILTHFWDQLNTEHLDHPEPRAPRNHAEIACQHLASIWPCIQKHGTEVVILVPSFYGREQLGILLSIARELSIPLKGFLPIALAASSTPTPEKNLLYLDIHLHRIEATYLEQGEKLILKDCVTATKKGLIHLVKGWVDAIAHEFVRTTRFDPLHQATSEQDLYNRLPGILSHFSNNPSIHFEISGGTTPYGITLDRDLLIRKAEPVYEEIRRLITGLIEKHEKAEQSVVLQCSHRLSRLPGCKEMLAGMKNVQLVELEPGAAAKGLPDLWNRLANESKKKSVLLYTSRPWQSPSQATSPTPSSEKTNATVPSHIMYRGIAYPITSEQLSIGLEDGPKENHLQIQGQTTGVSSKHCTIELHDGEVVLTDFTGGETFVDEKSVDGSAALRIGQIIRIGTPGEQLQLISCLQSDET